MYTSRRVGVVFVFPVRGRPVIAIIIIIIIIIVVVVVVVVVVVDDLSKRIPSRESKW